MKYLIAGLGNIGDEYAHTRHNIGFDVVAAFVAKHGGGLKQDRLAYTSEIRWKGRILICICPTTYMNLSGRSLKYWADKEKISLENILVILDDVSIPVSKLRIRQSGSDGGHNGLKSIQESLASAEYPRLRFGVGNDYPKGRQADYVLSKWKKEEEPVVKVKINTCVDIIESFATVGIQNTMNNFNNVEITL